MAVLALPVLLRFKRRVDHRQYNGAALLGLRSLVIKSHGSADAYAFEWAIKRAYDAVKNGVLERLARAMEENASSLEQATQAARGASGAGGGAATVTATAATPANPADPAPADPAASANPAGAVSSGGPAGPVAGRAEPYAASSSKA
jgi:glycerol-3-phosphate acyltransferase PlsX